MSHWTEDPSEWGWILIIAVGGAAWGGVATHWLLMHWGIAQ